MVESTKVLILNMSIAKEDPVVPITEYEEHILFQKLGRKIAFDEKSGKLPDDQESVKVRRLYRKLAVRKTQRRNGAEPFNILKEYQTMKDRNGTDSKNTPPNPMKSVTGFKALERFRVIRFLNNHCTDITQPFVSVFKSGSNSLGPSSGSSASQ